MKKGIVIGLLAVVVLVLVSPGVIGGIAKNSISENMEWAASQSGDFAVSSESFEGSWFTSTGEHRITMNASGSANTIIAAMGVDSVDDLPQLVVSTRLDHGLLPLASLSRENGSLMPALGNAVSTIRVESPDGEVFELPGEIYSVIGLGGSVSSSYELQAGSHADDDVNVDWGLSRLSVESNPSDGAVSFDGSMAYLELVDADEDFRIGDIRMSGSQAPSGYGFALGDFEFSLDSATGHENGAPVDVGPISATVTSSIESGKVSSEARMSMRAGSLPQVGEMYFDMDIALTDMDPDALKALAETLEGLDDTAPPDQIMGMIESDLLDFAGAGVGLEISQLNVGIMQNTIESSLVITVPPIDNPDWNSVLQAMTASANLVIPAQFVDMAMATNPDQVNMAIGLGFLRREGSQYVLDASYEKGLATVNGAPMPIPMPAPTR